MQRMGIIKLKKLKFSNKNYFQSFLVKLSQILCVQIIFSSLNENEVSRCFFINSIEFLFKDFHLIIIGVSKISIQLLPLQLSPFVYVYNLNMKSDNPKHQMRISIDLRALKDHDFTAQLSLRYAANPALGLSLFRSPSIAIPNARAEVTLKDCFLSGYFQATTADMGDKLSQKLNIELWHCDRLRKDQMLGCACLDLQKIIDMPLRRTSESYARVLDAFLPIDQLNQEGKPVKVVGSLRVIAYLQDLGPVQQLQQRGFNVRELLEESSEKALPSQREEQKQGMQNAGLNQLQRKVVWELQTWKKAEEAKTRLTLKQKEIEFWTNLSQQQRNSDLEKEKQFKKIEANLVLLEGKLRAKLAQLGKREQKILLVEQQLQTKISEVSRQCLLKDQEAEALRRRHKEEKTAVIKQKSAVQIDLAKLRAENARLRVELEEAKKEDEKSPLNILRSELNAKVMQCQQLGRELEKANQVKEQYKLYYGKMKDEVISLRTLLKEKEEAGYQMRREKDGLIANCKHLQQQLTYERQLHQQQQQQQQQQQRYHQNQDDWNEDIGCDDRGRLLRQREALIREANYTPNDPLIMQIDRQIKSLS